LFAGFGLVLALLMAVGAIGLKNTTDFAAQFKHLHQERLQAVTLLNSAEQGVYELRLGAAGLSYALAQRDPAVRVAIKARDEKWLKQIDDDVRNLEANLSAADKARLQDWKAAYGQFLKSRQQIIDLVDKNQFSDAGNVRSGDEFSALTQKTTDGIRDLITIQDETGKQMANDALAMADLSVRVLLFAMLAALGIGLGVAFFVSRGVARGVQEVQRVLTSITNNCATLLDNGLAAMANSDLTVDVHAVTQPIERYGKDELGQMAHVTNVLLAKLNSTVVSYERARASLGALIGEVRSAAANVADNSSHLGASADQTNAAVQQITSSIQNVASGAQDTSRSAQETNASVGQLTQAIDGIARGASEQARQVQSANDTASQMAAGVHQVAATAEQVATASSETRKAAEHGGVAVRDTTAAMAEIQRVVGQAASSVEELGKLGDKIGAVVETIDDIAEQTNLLALNAAIEAARAGEHGRGFAVVADEVRKLAERSSRETKQIAELIQQVQLGTRQAVKAMHDGAAKVEQGSQKADLAGQALDAILSAVDHTLRQAKEIASASRSMAAGAQRVTEAMVSISAIVEENTSATEEMSAQSDLVAQAIHSIAAVAEEQSASTEAVSASSEEMSAQIEEMSAQAQELSSTAEQLRELVARFRLAEAANNVVPFRRAA
jgi:methyl-accepting chemotaxis protein